MSESTLRRVRPSPWLVAGVIAATYLYFLLFAEFAFVALARPQFPSAPALRLFMGTLGLGGIVGSCLAALAGQSLDWSLRLSAGLGGCAVAGLAALVVRSPASFLLDAAAVGAALGWSTVTLAAGLKAALGNRLGTWIGIGTGLAYCSCNLPGIFTARPKAQTLLAAIIAGAAALAALRLRSDSSPVEPATSTDFEPAGRCRWVAVLLALVWLDSAAFFIIQNTPALKSQTWEGSGGLVTNAVVHLVAALLSGRLLDRSQRGSIAIAAWVLLASACIGLRFEFTAGSARLFYTAGVSLYSVLLVYYPAAGGTAWLAAAVYGLAGWLGSALGIGMAQELHRVPEWFLALSGAAILVALFGKTARTTVRSVIVLVLFLAGFAVVRAAPAPDRQVELGRKVYIGEGCIHCHSQYVRPGTSDVEWWGPAPSIRSAAVPTPPLFGNRRQGPDLTNVGNRRSAEWERLHLVDPAQVSPGSRMPGYAYLFRRSGQAGEALVAYLLSLGAETASARFAAVRAWQPPARGIVAGREMGRQLFRDNCAQCHGLDGAGDGPLASRLQPRPADLVAGAWRYAPAYGADESSALARIVKFGVAGTSMPGHEWLSDEQVMALVRTVRDFRAYPAP